MSLKKLNGAIINADSIGISREDMLKAYLEVEFGATPYGIPAKYRENPLYEYIDNHIKGEEIHSITNWGVKFIPKEIALLTNLKHLTLGSYIQELPSELFTLTNLVSLAIAENPLKLIKPRNDGFICLPEEIGNLENLKVLELTSTGGGRINFVPKEISKLKNLVELSINPTLYETNNEKDFNDIKNFLYYIIDLFPNRKINVRRYKNVSPILIYNPDLIDNQTPLTICLNNYSYKILFNAKERSVKDDGFLAKNDLILSKKMYKDYLPYGWSYYNQDYKIEKLMEGHNPFNGERFEYYNGVCINYTGGFKQEIFCDKTHIINYYNIKPKKKRKSLKSSK